MTPWLNDPRRFPEVRTRQQTPAVVVFSYPTSITSCRFPCPQPAPIYLLPSPVDPDRTRYLRQSPITIIHRSHLSKRISILRSAIRLLATTSISLVRGEVKSPRKKGDERGTFSRIRAGFDSSDEFTASRGFTRRNRYASLLCFVRREVFDRVAVRSTYRESLDFPKPVSRLE